MTLYSKKAIAKRLGLSEKEVQALTKTGVIKKGYLPDRGLYKLEDTAREVIANYKLPEDERENVDYTTERAKLMRIKRQNEEYTLQERKGELHRSEDIELIMSKMLISFKSRISAIPSKVAPEAAKMTDSAEIFDLVKKLTDEALTELSDYDTLFMGEEQ